MFNANQPRIDGMKAWREIAPAVRAAVADRYPVQKQLAGKMGVSRAALSAWLLGTHTPLFDSALRLVDEAGLSWASLMGESPRPLAIGSESVFPIRCEAVNVSAGPGAPWTEYPTKDDRDRHYFYRRSFVRAALNIPEDACGRCNQRAYEDEYITGPLPSRHCALDISRRARSDARDEPLDNASLGVVEPAVRRADERAPVR